MKKSKFSNMALSQILALENMVPLTVAFFTFLFSVWTIGHHFATFFRIPWANLSKAFLLSGPLLLLFALWCAYKFSILYSEEVKENNLLSGEEGVVVLVTIAISVPLILLVSQYSAKLLIAVVSLGLFWWFTENKSIGSENLAVVERKNISKSFVKLAVFISLVLLAVIASLVMHRPDQDDSSFLQMASQTLLNQDRPPLTFDTSLGSVLETFRFAPYRVSSYETAISFITKWTNLDLLTVYYLLVPSITTGLTLCVAYLFSRWFLSSNMAIFATVVFIIVMFAWGDTSIAFGNRVFVRLFQGKGLLVAITTPISIIAGLILVRRPSLINAIPLAITNVVAIGVSSSGLVLTIFTSMLLIISAVGKNYKKFAYAMALIIVTIVYPVILIFWLKFQNNSGVPLNEIGTYLPINSSLGHRIHESIALIIIVIGYLKYPISCPKKEYGLIVFGSLMFILNPYFSDLLSTVSARNMSWRLTWATPIPLLMCIGFTTTIAASFNGNFIAIKKRAIILPMVGVCLFVLFILTARWIFSEKNGVTLGAPLPKLPNNYFSTKAVADELNSFNIKGSILAVQDIAAWMPLVAPDKKLVMPGHTYPIMLQTVMSPSDFDSRMRLVNEVNKDKPDFGALAETFRKYAVEMIVTHKNVKIENMINSNYLTPIFSVEELSSVADYKIFKVNYATQ